MGLKMNKSKKHLTWQLNSNDFLVRIYFTEEMKNFMKSDNQNIDRQILIDFLLPSVEYFLNIWKNRTQTDIEEIKERVDFELTREDKLLVLKNEFDYLKSKWPDLSFYVKRRLDESFVTDYVVEQHNKLVNQNFNNYKNIAEPLLSDNLILEELLLLADFHQGKFNGFWGDAINQIQLISLVEEYDFINDQYQSLVKEDDSNLTLDKIEIATLAHTYFEDSSKNSNEDWLEIFFAPENNILPPEDHLKYKNLLYSETKKTIDIQKEPWKVFAMLMVWAVNGKLDLSEYDKKPKSKQLNVKVAHFMAEYFTFQGENKDNSDWNSNTFSMVSTKSSFKHKEFNSRLYLVCGKLDLNFPQSLQKMP
jgi:hypothetical protein